MCSRHNSVSQFRAHTLIPTGILRARERRESSYHEILILVTVDMETKDQKRAVAEARAPFPQVLLLAVLSTFLVQFSWH